MAFKTLIIAAFTSICIAAFPVSAADLKAPQGDVVLTVSGEIGERNKNGDAVFDMEMLDALPQTKFTTSTIWTQGKNTFSGVLLKDILKALNAGGTKIRAVAINDYAVEIPKSDAVAGGPIIATRMDGKSMSVRDKGPLWIVYPYDKDTKYRSETIYSRSIWQLSTLELSK